MAATFFRAGDGRSVNARKAESEGKMPLTRAVAELAKLAGITRKAAKAALAAAGPCEWHHVGKFAAEVDYYDPYSVGGNLSLSPTLAKLPTNWQDQISDAMTAAKMGTPAACAAREAKCQEFAAIAGLSVDKICDLYYTL